MYKPCLPHCILQSNHVAEYCHMTHYITVPVSITVLIMVTESQDVCSTTTTQLSYTSREACTLRRWYFKSALFEIPLHLPVSCIPVGNSLYTQLTRPFSLLCRSGSGLRDSAIASGWAGWVLAQPLFLAD